MQLYQLLISGKGLLGCGTQADTILLRAPAFLWAVSQKYQGETQFSSGYHTEGGSRAGNALLILHRQVYPAFLDLDLPPAWQFLEHLPTNCCQCPSKHGPCELKFPQTPSVASETPAQVRAAQSNRGAGKHIHSSSFFISSSCQGQH